MQNKFLEPVKESKWRESNWCKGLSINNKHIRAHALGDCSLGQQGHSCIHKLHKQHCNIRSVFLHNGHTPQQKTLHFVVRTMNGPLARKLVEYIEILESIWHVGFMLFLLALCFIYFDIKVARIRPIQLKSYITRH